MSDAPYQVLFLCSDNAARSIMAEALMNHYGKGRFVAHSAGNQPRGEVDPLALEILQRHNIPAEGLSSKSWDEFTGPQAPALDFVFTLSDSAAAEPSPDFPGPVMSAHWGVPNPATVEGPERERIQAFRMAYHVLDNRIKIFTSLPIRSLDRMRLQQEVDAIGTAQPEAPSPASD